MKPINVLNTKLKETQPHIFFANTLSNLPFQTLFSGV